MNRALSNISKRAYVTKARRTKDPLARASNADRYVLAEGGQFIVRPPPSLLPPTYPIPVGRSDPALLDKRESNAFLKAVLSPVSYLQSDPPKQTGLPLNTPQKTATVLSEEQIQDLRNLRKSDPETWTWSRLAEKFSVSRSAVATLAWDKTGEARAVQKQYARERQVKLEGAKEKWGWRKTIVRQERDSRRSRW